MTPVTVEFITEDGDKAEVQVSRGDTLADAALEGWLGSLGVQYEQGHPKVGGFSLEILAGIVGIVIVVALGTLLARRKSVAVESAAPDRTES